MVSKHLLRVRGKRRKRKVRDIQGWTVSATAVSSQTQHEDSLLPWKSCFESQSLSVPAGQPPTPFLGMPDGLIDLIQHNWNRIIPVLALGSILRKKGGFFSVWVRAGPSGLENSGHQVAASKHILWPPVVGPQSGTRCSFSPCQNVLAAQLATCLHPTDGALAGLYQTAVLGATGGRPRLCPGQQLHWSDSAWQDGPHVPLPLYPNSSGTRALKGLRRRKAKAEIH